MNLCVPDLLAILSSSSNYLMLTVDLPKHKGEVRSHDQTTLKDIYS